MKVLVTDGENRSALAVTRSLGRRGNCVIVTGATNGNLAAASRFCQKSYSTKSSLKEGREFAEEITAIAVKEQVDIIFPMTEQSIHQLNKFRNQLPSALVLACAPHEAMEAVSDKYRLFQLAQRIGIPVPATIYVDGYEDFCSKEFNSNLFPVVVKPALSKIPDGDKLISTNVMYASSQAELARLYETNPALRYPSLIQEMIIGEGTGLFTLFDVDSHLALFAHQRLLEKPPSGGVSVLSQSIPLDPEMVEAGKKLLETVGWKGVAMVEFKRDIRDGRAKLIEINGRFWGSLQLAVSAGIDFPSLYLDYCFGKKPAAPLKVYRTEHRLKWPFGLLDHLIIRLKKKDQMRGLGLDIPTRWKLCKMLLQGGAGGTSYDVLDFDDLGPFGVEVKNYGKR
jgi:predicted ATP-grasp superfamily ATP-dependent carboligase